MVFPSVPLYMDPPNWNHQYQAHQQQPAGDGGHDYHQLQPGSAQRSEGAMAPPAARPGSMADRARLAKLPQPEPALKCPRCDSTNTKFCYFNNYSLSQPRHFCKTCRRYWTRGGALRNVPVGGGCRRNKRSKFSGSSSKSQSANAGGATSSSSAAITAMIGGVAPANLASASQMPFMASLHHLGEYGAPSLGLNFSGMQPIDVDYQVGGSSSSVGLEQWRIQQIQQFPFFGGMEAAAPAPVQGLYNAFDHGEGGGGVDTSVFAGAPAQGQKGSSSGLISQMSSVKMEDSSQGLNLQRPYLSMARNDQFWGGGGGADGVGGSGAISGIGSSSVGGWMTNLSGFNSSSSDSLL